ncbi:CPBP family intramembrane glutamic endopeptidase [Cyanobium gracile UHCC 0139]|uniref:CPBP family intramembrane glutamic endopeptidase n=1 Tax=Cyanobium gracile UHCC 0139 TaxID=3110308 RepID=A0ABU5RV61_9CYAN|nr:CPBP family intramembrane glutamic endopeptidase [Cyanobium gracile]MEA5391667.1 CPBP family intramembrane glutamic endopeptidase [Cyanobium gracile UHCC 0139]
MIRRWIGTLLYVPVLYGLGWLLVRPLAVLTPALPRDRLDLLGTAMALLLLLLSLPAWIRRVWGEQQPWRQLGVVANPARVTRAFVRGLLKAALLLALVAGILLISGQAGWQGQLNALQLLNALALLLGVGFAEELLFRGWLWGELERHLGRSRALWGQALVFSLAHTRFNLGPAGALGLLGGLTMLGLVLALQRRADGGLLWGAVGLHGGLVGGWFLLQGGALTLAPETSAWLVGPGGAHPNPIGGAVGWLGLGMLLWVRRRWWQRGGIQNTTRSD